MSSSICMCSFYNVKHVNKKLRESINSPIATLLTASSEKTNEVESTTTVQANTNVPAWGAVKSPVELLYPEPTFVRTVSKTKVRSGWGYCRFVLM